HGGILATLLDETMNHVLSHNGEPVATAELTVRYREPARVGVPPRVEARLLKTRPPLYTAEAETTDPQGSVVAEASAKLMRVEAEEIDRA
ncbi:MAG: PaaI family thioesterase, partial [Gemmatimonadota bacterium]|nr:PaaI family thioesterase [Gemmatimonadota bacterium]